MRDQDLDQLFKDKLEHYASATPEHLWDAIDKGRSVKTPIWYTSNKVLGLSVLVLLISGIVFLGFQTATKDNLKDEKQIKNEHINASSSANINTLNNSPISSSTTETTIAQTNTTSLNSNTFSKTQALTDQSVSQRDLASNKAKNNAINAQLNQVTKSKFEQAQKTNIPINNNTKPSSPNLLNTHKETILTPVSEEQQTNFSNQKERASTGENQQISADLVKEIIASPAKKNIHVSVAPLLVQLNEFNLNLKNNRQDYRCAKFKERHKPEHYVDVFTAMNYASKQLGLKNNADGARYLQYRNDTESFKSSFSVGGRVSTVYHTGLALRTGLVYSKITERIDLFGLDELPPEIDPALLRETYHHNMIDLPIIIGFESFNNRMAWSVNTGLYINLLFRQDGFILSPELEPVLLDPEHAEDYPIYKVNMGASLFGSLNWSYRLNEGVSILLEPQIRYTLGDLTNNDYILNQRYLTVGMAAGLRCHF